MTKFSLIIFLFLFVFIISIVIRHYYLKMKIKKDNDKIYKILFLAKIILLILISFFISLTFSSYKAGLKKVVNYSTFIDNIILIDYSTSMLANDLKPTRFDQAKNLALYLVENSNNCRFALILFGDDPLLEVPLTDNIEYLKNIISTIQINDDYYRASNILLAFYAAINLLESSPSFYKNIVLLSDFDFDQVISEKLNEMLLSNINNLYSVIISSEEGSKIWLPNKKTYLVDKFQNEVFSSPNRQFISSILKLPNSLVSDFNNMSYNSIVSIINSNKKLTSKMEKHETYAPRELNFIFGSIAAFLMIIFIILSTPIFQNLNYKTKNYRN
ncbi:MAG: VWA domain-containing protein [Spirochaetales bacterium]|nr:VWA domain-containing protein [Spirochaetales bacterium]